MQLLDKETTFTLEKLDKMGARQEDIIKSSGMNYERPRFKNPYH
jgi:hypothetical protein